MGEDREKKAAAADMKKEAIAGLVMVLLFFAFFIFSFSITEKTVTGVVSSRTVPQFVSILGIIVSLYLTITKWLGYKKNREVAKDEEKVAAEPRLWKRIIISTILLTGYISLINVFGYILTSIIYLFLQITTIYEKRDKKSIIIIAIISIAIPLILYIPFRYVFNLMIPTGTIFR